jgi:hypothetical protein
MAESSLPITDDLWLAAHDSVNGKSRLTPGPLGIGLGVGLLAELLFERVLTLEQQRLYLLNGPVPDDPALAPVYHQFLGEERARGGSAHDLAGHDVREWIAYLAADGRGEELVVRRLSQGGNVTRQERRGLVGRKKVVFLPRDTSVAGWPASRLSRTLERGGQLGQTDLVLAGLFLATGLHQQALDWLTAAHFKDLAQQLGTDMHPMLRELVRHAESAVGEAVMNR